MAESKAKIMAGIPSINAGLYRRIRFSVGDPVAFILLHNESVLILRDIEMERARQKAAADRVACPADFTPEGGLSGDRETATAQAAAECLRRAGVTRVTGDRSLPLIFAEMIQRAGIVVDCDLEMGVIERRSKDAAEIQCLRESQRITEGAIKLACELIANAEAREDGILMHQGEPLTSERVRAAVDVWLLEQGFSNPIAIIAGGSDGADCHNLGSGELRTGQPVIVDIFPRSRATGYNGDCTRTVVHGVIPDELIRMNAAVVAAKAAGIAAIRPGVTGEEVHRAVAATIEEHGYSMGLPAANAPPSYCAMTHGTGHGVGLEVHEPPLLDFKGPELVIGDVVTVEPGVYSQALGGVRVEDMVVVTPDGCENLNHQPEGLNWA
jgi:Xaa-Pro aminopeptidase